AQAEGVVVLGGANVSAVLWVLRVVVIKRYDPVTHRSHHVAQMIGQLIAFIASYKLLGTRITAAATVDSGFALKEVVIYSAPFEDSHPGILTINLC
ncbi:MAG: hypothetical protein AAFN93_22945, partial [Bacteroidota bacterium]